MRDREAMLKDAGTARRRYAHLTNPEDMLVIRLAADVVDLLAEIERLKAIVQFGAAANNSHLDEIIQLRVKIKELRDEIT